MASEETQTLIVNAHGTLIQLALTVEIGQLLGIKNLQTMEQLVCRVVYLGAEQLGKREVGIEYEVPSPRFWRVTFPQLIGRLEARKQKPRRNTCPVADHR